MNLVLRIIRFALSKRIYIFALAISWTWFIFFALSLPSRRIPALKFFLHFDKTVHVVFFLVLAILWLSWFAKGKNRVGLSTCLFFVMISLVFGFAMEFYQLHFVEGRSFDLWDGLADGIGSVLGSALFLRLIHKLIT